MSKLEKVSILTAAYNAGKTIKSAIESVLNHRHSERSEESQRSFTFVQDDDGVCVPNVETSYYGVCNCQELM